MSLKLPAAWEQCAEGVCGAVKGPTPNNDAKKTSKVEMDKAPESTCKNPCVCKLFSAKKDDADDKADWSWEYEPDHVSKAETKKFKWLCVKPVLEEGTLCATGECADPVRNKDKNNNWECKPGDKCAAPCECKLYKWGKGDREEKWKRAKIQIRESGEEDFVYACFCVK